MKVHCSFLTPQIRKLAEVMSMSPEVVNNMVSAWQTDNNTIDQPSKEDLEKFMKTHDPSIYYLAVPNFTIREFQEGLKPIEVQGHEIILTKIPKIQNWKEYFTNMFKNSPDIVKKGLNANLNSSVDCLYFLLWREMYFIENGLRKTRENANSAEIEAIRKLIFMHKSKKKSEVKSETKPEIKHMDIWWGDEKSEGRQFSNMALRPFTINPPASEVMGSFYDNTTFNSVEQAFQAIKYMTSMSWEESEDSQREKMNVINEILNSTDPKEIKRLGKKVHLSKDEIDRWNARSSEVMKDLIKQSFAQNPEAMIKLFETGNTIFTHNNESSKWGKEFPRILMEVRKELYNEIKDKVSTDAYKNIFKIKSTVAPYYSTSIDEYNNMSDEQRNTMRKTFSHMSHVLSDLLGLKFKSGDTSFNIGGFTFEEGPKAGEHTTEPSFTFLFDTEDTNLVDLFSSLMGDLAYEQQEAVISYNYTENNPNAIEHTIGFNNLEGVVETLAEVGIEDYTIDTTNKVIKLLSFDEEEHLLLTEKICKLEELLKNNYNEERSGYSNIQSRYLDKKSRRDIYKTWLKTHEQTKENGNLYSTIQEAYRKVKNAITKSEYPFFNRENKSLNKGAVVEYNGKMYLYWGESSTGKAKIINTDGTKFSGTPGKDKLKVLGNYVTTTYNNTDYIVTNNGNIYSGATGDLVYTGDDNSSKIQKQRIIDQAFKEVNNKNKSSNSIIKSDVTTVDSSTLNDLGQAADSMDEGINVPLGPNPFGEDINWEEVIDNSPSITIIPEEQPEAQEEQEEEEIPPIGIDVVDVDKENPLAKAAVAFSPIERTDRVEMLARVFSVKVNSFLSQLIESTRNDLNEELAKENKDEQEIKRLSTNLLLYQDSEKGRKAVIETITIESIFESMKNEYKEYAEMDPEDLDDDPEEGKRQVEAYKKIVDNFDVLIQEACVIIEDLENIRIIVREHSIEDGSESVIGGNPVLSSQDADNIEKQNEDDPEGERVTGNEGWSYQVRFVNPMTSLSKDTKRVLSSIQKLNPDGSYDTDDLGNPRYLHKEFAHAALINDLANMVDADDFVSHSADGKIQLPALEFVSHKHPWVKQVIRTLENDPRLISEFYADFRKDFIPYYMNIDGHSKALNKPAALDSTMSALTRNYEQSNILDTNSIYKSGMGINTDNVKIGQKMAVDLLDTLRDFREEDYYSIVEKSSKMFKMLGIPTTEDAIKALLDTPDGISDLNYTIQRAYDIFNGLNANPKVEHLVDSYKEEYTAIAEKVGLVLELDNKSSFRQGDQTRYSYSAPNYLDTMFKIFKNDSRRDSYLADKYKKYAWFYDPIKGWKNEWARLIESDEDVRANLDLREMPYIDKVKYKDWEPMQIKRAFILEYFSIKYNPKSEKQYAFYNFPIFSDSPVVKFVKFIRYTGDFKSKLIPLFNKLVRQELWRIDFVEKRRKAGVDEITNFDKNGDKFFFIPRLNSYMVGGKTFLQTIRDLVEIKDNDAINSVIDKAVTDIMDDELSEFYKNYKGDTLEKLTEQLKDNKVISDDSEMPEALEEYFWNSCYATSQIIQLTTTDLAYYKNGVDFQKRYKELYAAGTKLNTNSDLGKKFETTVYLSDQVISSPSLTIIKRVLDKAVKDGRIQDFDRDAIIHKFEDINVADAQAFRSLKSFKSVLDMLGKWTPEMKTALDNFVEGNWQMSDFMVVWQTIKPFVYTQIEKDSGVTDKHGNEILMKVPHQNKNSEFLLLSMYQIVANSLGNSNKLKAINQFMDDNDIDVIQFESAVKAGKQGVVNINYSQPKLQRVLKEDIHKDARASIIADRIEKFEKEQKKKDPDFKKISDKDIENIENIPFVYDEFKEYYDKKLIEGKITQEEYNKYMESIEPDYQEVYNTLKDSTIDSVTKKFKPNVVHQIPYDDYVIQQPTPEHLFDVEAVFGSQFRNLIISDLPKNFSLNVNGKIYNKEEIIKLYQSLIIENLIEDFDSLRNRFNNIEELQKAMLDQIEGNSKYGRDMVNALQLIDFVKDDGTVEKRFNIPLNTPSITLQIQELVNSMFKNKIAKQYIKGGACILVSAFGKTDKLHIQFKNSKGEIINREWFNKNIKTNKSYEEWAKEALNKGDISIAGMECYLPAYSKKFYTPFLVKKKTDDGKIYYELDVNKMPENLRKIIGYRIPTEDKYSMAPLIIKGFLPQQNGSSIMVPAEITQIAGSDFDVDKMFLMIPEFSEYKQYNIKAAWDTFYETHPDIVEKIDAAKKESFAIALDKAYKEYPDAEVSDSDLKKLFKKYVSGYKNYEWIDGVKEAFQKWFVGDVKESFYEKTIISKVEADQDMDINDIAKNNSRRKRNNLLIDISYSILTHPDTASKILNPGNFDRAKLSARIAKISEDRKMVKDFIHEFNLYDTLNNINEKSEKKITIGELVSKALLNTDILKMDKNVAEKLKGKSDLEILDDFVKKYTKEINPLSLDTFIYNHRQNMTGGALIGMYANNTTMQAKYQALNLYIKDQFSFNINGRRPHSLSAITSELGERISENCANFSAASVDNVKDPVLADLMQNRNTAFITGFMLRAGMSIKEIGLLFTQPIVKSCIESTGSLYSLDKYVNGCLKNLIEEAEKSDTPFSVKVNLEDDYILNRNFTSEELMNNIINNTLGYTYEETQDSYDKRAQEIEAAQLMVNIVKLADDFRGLTGVSRADSPKGAIETSIAKAKNQIHNLEIYNIKSKKKEFRLGGFEDIITNNVIQSSDNRDVIRQKLNNSTMPMLQAFYSLGIDCATSIISDYFPQVTEYSDTMLNELYMNSATGVLDDSIINDFYDGMINYFLSGTKLFGDDDTNTFDEKRNYYLYKFPKQYLKVIDNNPDIAELSIFKKIGVLDGVIQMVDSGRLTSTVRETLMRDFDMLMYMDNPNAQRLAIDLFMYAYYREGFKFGPNSFGGFFSSTFMSYFPEYINSLRDMSSHINIAEFSGYLDQFYINNKNVPNLVKSISFSKVKDFEGNSISLSINSVLNRITEVEPNQIIKIEYIDGSSKLYTFSKLDDSGEYAIYNPLPEPDISDGPKYNSNMSIEQMEKVKEDKELIEENKMVNYVNRKKKESNVDSSLTDQNNNNYMYGIENNSSEDIDSSVYDMHIYDQIESMKELEENMC